MYKAEKGKMSVAEALEALGARGKSPLKRAPNKKNAVKEYSKAAEINQSVMESQKLNFSTQQDSFS